MPLDAWYLDLATWYLILNYITKKLSILKGISIHNVVNTDWIIDLKTKTASSEALIDINTVYAQKTRIKTEMNMACKNYTYIHWLYIMYTHNVLLYLQCATIGSTIPSL